MRKPSPLLTALFTATITSSAFGLRAEASPETDSARIAGNLKSYSDQDWAKIAGARSSEKYEVARGDTLWDISERLFGDAKVWPKVWEINNATVLNPHMIEPRMALLFNSGSGLSLPSLVLGSALNNAGTTTVKNHYVVGKDDRPGPVWDEKTPFPSSEWRNLPRQSWENVDVNLPPNVDKDGFDSNNRVYLRKPATGLELPHFVACEPIKALARVEGTRNLTTYVDRGTEITIQPTGGKLEVGQVYSMLDAQPSELSTGGRKALSYDILGKVKILGLQSGTYVGEITASRETIPRGSLVVPLIARIEKSPPVAGASKVKGTIIADRRTGAFMSGQHKWIYVNRGTKDGVEPGMIFRIFQNTDPRTNAPLTKGDVFVSGDAQIVQGCGDFSIGMFVWSRGEVPEQYEGYLLTDVSDEKIRFYFNGEASDIPITETPPPALTPPEGIVDAPKPEPKEEIVGPGPSENPDMPLPPIAPTEEKEALVPEFKEELKSSVDGDDWLDKLDNHQELQGEEENELRELEKFRESEAARNQAAPPATEPPPAGDSPFVETPTGEPTNEAIPPPPVEGFPAEETIVETPSTVVNPNPPTESAAAPKPAPTSAPTAPEDPDSIEGLAPL